MPDGKRERERERRGPTRGRERRGRERGERRKGKGEGENNYWKRGWGKKDSKIGGRERVWQDRERERRKKDSMIGKD